MYVHTFFLVIQSPKHMSYVYELTRSLHFTYPCHYDTRSMINSFWLVEPFGVEMYGTHKSNFSIEGEEAPPIQIYI